MKFDPKKPFDRDKFKELILYISDKCKADPNFGDTKLNKILYYSEMRCFVELGKPITGQKFQHLEHGPGSKPLLPVREEMQRDGACVVNKIRLPDGKPQTLTTAIKKPELTDFSAQEIEIVDSVIRGFWWGNADSVSDDSHDEPGWFMTDEREEIPYETFFFVKRPPTPGETEYALELAAGRSPKMMPTA